MGGYQLRRATKQGLLSIWEERGVCIVNFLHLWFISVFARQRTIHNQTQLIFSILGQPGSPHFKEYILEINSDCLFWMPLPSPTEWTSCIYGCSKTFIFYVKLIRHTSIFQIKIFLGLWERKIIYKNLLLLGVFPR